MSEPAQPVICGWARHSELEHRYHDQEWGRLKTDDRTLFEFLVLESAQAGLSWKTILTKRDHYRHHYRDFDPELVAEFGAVEVSQMLADPGLIRNRAKIESSIKNARIFLEISREFGGFANYLWSFMGGLVVVNQWQNHTEAPVSTELSRSLAKDLKRRGMRFLGETIVYAYLQACGYVNDHILGCSQRIACLEQAKGHLPQN